MSKFGLSNRNISNQTFITETELAERWNVSIKMLQNQRWRGDGLRFHKFGSAVRYSLVDIEMYEAECARNSTSEGGA